MLWEEISSQFLVAHLVYKAFVLECRLLIIYVLFCSVLLQFSTDGRFRFDCRYVLGLSNNMIVSKCWPDTNDE